MPDTGEKKHHISAPAKMRKGISKVPASCAKSLCVVVVEEKMKLYHGSKDPDIKEFKLINNRDNLDFGLGVYLTKRQNQAEQWAGKGGAVYVFEIDLSDLHIKEYSDEDLDYVLYLCRIALEDVARETIDGFDNADVIAGQMLDGSIHGFKEIAEMFNEGDVSYEKLTKMIKLFSKKDQLCFKTQKAVDLLNKSLIGKYRV